jgi:outer membrane receptor protein involved in Fe transport
VGADWDLNPSSMMYANVSRGFKAGGFFASGNSSDLVGNKFNPETLLAYAVGSKNRFNGDRVQPNGEAFFWDYKNHQENYLAPSNTGGSFNFVTQKADAEIYGLDLELDLLLSGNDKLSSKLQYLNAKYTRARFINASPGPGNPGPISVCATSQRTPASVWYNDCTGQEMPRSPKISATLDYSHTFRMASGAGVIVGATAQYSAKYWAAVDYNPLQRQASYTKWDANLTDEVVFTNAFMYPASNNTTNYTSFTQLAAAGYLEVGSTAMNPQPGVAMRIVDTHHHMIPPFYVEAVGAQNIAATMPSGVLPEWSVQKDLELMDRYGIGKAVLSASPGLLSITGARCGALSTAE